LAYLLMELMDLRPDMVLTLDGWSDYYKRKELRAARKATVCVERFRSQCLRQRRGRTGDQTTHSGAKRAVLDRKTKATLHRPPYLTDGPELAQFGGECSDALSRRRFQSSEPLTRASDPSEVVARPVDGRSPQSVQ
jgi:hypothetical protein